MGPEVDPLNYILHIIFFLWASTLFGLILHVLIGEIKQDGWVLSPRVFLVSCALTSAACDVIKDLDPHCFLGLYSPSAFRVMEYLGTSLMVDTGSCAIYMYMMVIYQQNPSKVHDKTRLVWLWTNISLTAACILFIVIGAASNNMFWMGVATWVLQCHLFMMMALINVSLSLLSAALSKLTNQVTGEKFSAPIRKSRILRVWVSVLVIACIVNQLVGSSTDNAFTRLQWGKPVLGFGDPSFFDATSWFSTLLACLAHSALLYVVRRPTQRKETKLSSIEVSQQTTSTDSKTNRFSVSATPRGPKSEFNFAS